jgi:hypothetical protein
MLKKVGIRNVSGASFLLLPLSSPTAGAKTPHNVELNFMGGQADEMGEGERKRRRTAHRDSIFWI